MEFKDETHSNAVLEALHKQQTESTHLCDVILRVEDEKIPAHSCVLAACSDYFKTLLTGNFEDCRAKDYNIPKGPLSHQAIYSEYRSEINKYH